MAEKKLFLLDALALIYRAHFAFIKNPRISSKGVNTSAVFGFVNSLLQIIEKEKPTHLAVAFDLSGPTFRHEIFPEYKAQREETPEDIRIAIPTTKKLLKALNIPILEMEGYEADDVIGTIAKRAEKHGYEVYMVTPDKDYAQLVSEKVFLYKPASFGNGIDIYNPEKVKEKFGVLPDKIIDFLGLKGDKVDNIPGIPKVGDKTAVELINEFGTVEEIVANAEKISKNSIKLSVSENGEQGILSKKLATIITDAPVPWDEEDCLIGNPDRKATIDMLNELEFRTTATRILQSPIFTNGKEVQTDLFGNVVGLAPTPKAEAEAGEVHIDRGLNHIENRKHDYVLINNEEDLKDLVSKIKKYGSFCFDTETTGLDPMIAEIIALTISMKPGEAYFIHFPKGDKKSLEQLEILKDVLENEKILKIGQNLKYDMLLLRNYGIKVNEPIFDTMLAHYCIDPDLAHGMDAMAMELLKYEPVSITSLIGKKGKAQMSMRDVPLDKLVEYACEDADITLEIKEKLDPEVDSREVRKVLNEVEFPLVPVLTDMEFNGVKVDEKFLNDYSKELETELLLIEKDIYGMAGMKFNINSPRQLGEIIFNHLQLAKGSKTKTGQYSTKEEVLVRLAEDHELPAYVLRYRKLGKLKSTYVDTLPALINPKTGRIHSTFSQAVAATGRLASNNPNLQNIPIRSDEGKEIRKAFIAEKGFKILSADYSQVELRLVAHLSGDEAMIEDFRAGHDIHKATAARVFGVAIDEVDGNMRSKAKMVNFGIIYGISAFGLAQRLKISRTEAAEIIEAYFEKYSGIKTYMDNCINTARETGFTTTVKGRKRYLPDINSANATVRGFAERNAINSPVQGSAADLIKVAMINIHKEMSSKNMKSKMIMQVHDELVFEVHDSEIDALSKIVKEGMENAIHFDVPMLVEVGKGENWLDAH